jgi:hypothetical protein
VLGLRLICTQAEDYSAISPVEPSAARVSLPSRVTPTFLHERRPGQGLSIPLDDTFSKDWRQRISRLDSSGPGGNTFPQSTHSAGPFLWRPSADGAIMRQKGGGT